MKNLKTSNLTNDAIVRLQHIAIAGDLQRLLAIRHDHDSLHVKKRYLQVTSRLNSSALCAASATKTVRR